MARKSNQIPGKSWVKWVVLAAVVLALALWFILSSGNEDYRAKYENQPLDVTIEGIGRDNTYELYLAAHADARDASQDVAVDLTGFAGSDGVEMRAEGLFMPNGSTTTWTANVPVAGYYNVRLHYLTTASRGVDLERTIEVNGVMPFDGADSMTFTRLWTNGGEVRKDNQGNEIRPSQVEVFDWQTGYCKDAMGYVTEPYRFYFNEGENTLTLIANSEPMMLTAPVSHPDYAAYVAAQPQTTNSQTVANFSATVQGEAAERRSSPSLYPRYDRSSPATVPYNVYQTVLNYIGGDAWRDAGQWIEWKVTVPEDGWYNITVKGRQNYSRGSLSSRALLIDGEVPFKDMEDITFTYDNSWVMKTLADDKGTPFRFYLTAGEHTLRLEATMGEMGPILARMEESIYRLNQMYRKVLVLTGVNPDTFRDYHINQVYPEVVEAMGIEYKLLYKLVDDTVAITGQKSDRIAVAQTLAVQLEEFYDDPDKITQVFTNFKDNITSLGTAMQALRECKLDVDEIIVCGENVKPAKRSEGFFAKMIHEITSMFASYTIDYDSLGDVYADGEAIQVWILTGRDQSTILKTMVDDTFTPATGIPVNVKLVDPGALLSAVVAGNGPDVVVSTDTWNPVNYALRHAVEDLTQFEDLDEVLTQYYPSAYAAFNFEGGVYALPETQLCNVLFYRTDILEEYGLRIPETWEDLIEMLPTIQGANMAVGIPYPDITAPNLSTLYSMLYQNDGTIYDKDARVTTISEEPGVKAFEMYTSLYNDYGLPLIFDFVSRFRSGEMPMGIFDYTVFNTLTVSAPEIRGLWDIAVIPGTAKTDADGNRYVDHSGHSQGACCMMIAGGSEKVKKNCWEFMKWWTSTDSQVRFGREIESVLGSSARYATANLAAIDQLAWSENQLKVIHEQMNWAIGFREVAGGYYTTRHLTNAVRRVTNDKTDPRETLLEYARTINEEIVKKRTEFGLPVD